MSNDSGSSTVTRRQLLRGAAAFSFSSILTGCGAGLLSVSASSTQATAGTPLPNSNPQPLPQGTVARASMTVGSSGTGAIGSGFVGLSYEKQTISEPLFAASNGDLLEMFGLLGRSVLRLGGNSADTNVWTPNGHGGTAGQIAPADVDALAGFLRASGWRCLYAINLGGSATGATTPALAAAEVAYVVAALGTSLLGIEIGNECENYADPGSYYYGNWSLTKFEGLWRQYRSAILAVTPKAPIAGPAAGSDVAGWTLPFGQSVSSSAIDLLTQHYYRGPANVAAATAANLLSPDAALVAELAMLKAGADSVGVPFRMAECNSFWSGGQLGVSNAYASSLWAIDMVFQCALGGAAGVNFQGGGQGDYTPIEDLAGVVKDARPVFYGLLLASLAGTGAMLSTDLAAGALNVTAYAVKTAAGGLNVVVVNKDAAQHLDLAITLPAFARNPATATLLELTQASEGASGPSLSATSGVTIQGAGVAADGTFAAGAAYTLSGGGAQISCYVPALSAVLIEVGF